MLIVEDEYSQADVLSLLLKLEGFEVAVAVHGQDAIAQMPRVQPALIVTDYMMPVMTGGEMARQIRQTSAYQKIPIVMTSATLPEQVEKHSKFYDVFLRKPYQWDDLLAAIKRLLGDGGSLGPSPPPVLP
ncbi:MAG: response regulator [Pseudomonadota bacterium]|nr:response regulator [Pseudomonadota bacterium]